MLIFCSVSNLGNWVTVATGAGQPEQLVFPFLVIAQVSAFLDTGCRALGNALPLPWARGWVFWAVM